MRAFSAILIFVLAIQFSEQAPGKKERSEDPEDYIFDSGMEERSGLDSGMDPEDYIFDSGMESRSGSAPEDPEDYIFDSGMESRSGFDSGMDPEDYSGFE